MTALLTSGAESHSVLGDHPLRPSERGQTFFDTLPVSPANKKKTANGNADRLLRLVK